MSGLGRADARRTCTALVLMCILPAGCGDDAASEAPDGGSRERPADAAAGDHDGGRLTDAGRAPTITAEPLDVAAYLYDQGELRTYELRLTPEALAQIDANPSAEQYVPGMLLFEEREYGPVGIRYKGSVGAFRGCLTAQGGAKACTKLSMKVSFNWLDPEGRFYGLRKLQFHAMNRDPSMLKERLGYAMMRESGLAAPRAVHARLLINGQLVGLFALVEQIDGRFTRSRFGEGGEGNLYKEAWPLRSDNSAINDATLRMRLETNEDEQPALDGMLAFGRALEQSGADTLGEVVAGFTDIDYAMRYVAVDRTIAHDDGPFHWYCGPNGCSNHNYYWYEEAQAERLWLIAWDLDSAFNLDNLTTTLWMSWEDTTLGCAPVTRAPFMIPQRASLCDKLTFGWAQLQERYLTEVDAFLTGPFAAGAVEDKLSAWEGQIAPAVDEAAAIHADALHPDAWRTATAALRSAIAQLRGRALDRIARGKIPPSNPWPMTAADAGAMDAGTMEPAIDAASPQDAANDPAEDAGEPHDPDLDAGDG